MTVAAPVWSVLGRESSIQSQRSGNRGRAIVRLLERGPHRKGLRSMFDLEQKPAKYVEPEKWYIAVDRAKCGEGIAIAEAPKPIVQY